MAKKTSKEYEIGFRIAADMEADFVRTFSSAAKSVEGVQDELKQLKDMQGPGDKMRELRNGLKQSEEAFQGTARSANSFMDKLKNVAEYTGAFKLVSESAESFTDIVGTATSYESAMKQIQVATGATAKEMSEMKGIAENLYNQKLGEDFKDLSEAISKARQVTGLQGKALEQTTKSAIVYRDVFGEDLAASLKAVDTMTKNFGVTSQQAFNLLAQGAQKGLDKSGELLDTANEYAPYFAKLGFDANQMFDVFSAGLEAGAFNLDKVGDGIKEFGIRTKDGSKQSLEAYEALQLSGEEMTQQFAAGGDVAQKAFLKTVKAINAVEDPAKRSAISVQLFGTQAEDLEDRVIKSYGNIQKRFDMARETMEEIGAVKYDSAVLSFEGLGREMMTEYILPLSQDLLPRLHELSDWATENKGLIKNLVVAFAAGGAVKGIAKVTGSISELSAKAAAGGKSMQGFVASALGLTNPVGIAVTAVGAAAFAFTEFKRHQEAARKELLTMGDSLKKAYSDYQGVQNQTKQTKDLIKEYDALKGKITDAKIPSDQLAQARERLQEVEEKLIELNPDILKSEDAKSARFREQLGLADKLNTTKSEMAKRDLEKAVLDNQAKLPDLRKEYEQLSNNLNAYNQAYTAAKESYVQYQEYVNQQQGIVQHLTGVEQQQELQKLAKQIQADTGKYYGDNWATMALDMADFRKKFDGAFEGIKSAESDMATVKDSFQAIYDTQKQMIEMNLGGSLEDQSKKMGSLSTEEKVRFEQALNSMSNLNRELNMLPTEKQVNVRVLYSDAGMEAPKEASDFLKYPFSMPKFEMGGVATRPSIFGEAGPEMAIPLNNKPRSRELLEQTNRMMGYTGGDTIIQYNPSIVIQGNGDKAAVEQAVKAGHDDFERRIRSWEAQKARVNMGA